MSNNYAGYFRGHLQHIVGVLFFLVPLICWVSWHLSFASISLQMCTTQLHLFTLCLHSCEGQFSVVSLILDLCFHFVGTAAAKVCHQPVGSLPYSMVDRLMFLTMCLLIR